MRRVDHERLGKIRFIATLYRQAPVSIAENYDVAWTIGVIRSFAIAAIMFFGAVLLSMLFHDEEAVQGLRLMALWPVFMARHFRAGIHDSLAVFFPRLGTSFSGVPDNLPGASGR